MTSIASADSTIWHAYADLATVCDDVRAVATGPLAAAPTATVASFLVVLVVAVEAAACRRRRHEA